MDLENSQSENEFWMDIVKTWFIPDCLRLGNIMPLSLQKHSLRQQEPERYPKMNDGIITLDLINITRKIYLRWGAVTRPLSSRDVVVSGKRNCFM